MQSPTMGKSSLQALRAERLWLLAERGRRAVADVLRLRWLSVAAPEFAARLGGGADQLKRLCKLFRDKWPQAPDDDAVRATRAEITTDRRAQERACGFTGLAWATLVEFARFTNDAVSELDAVATEMGALDCDLHRPLADDFIEVLQSLVRLHLALAAVEERRLVPGLHRFLSAALQRVADSAEYEMMIDALVRHGDTAASPGDRAHSNKPLKPLQDTLKGRERLAALVGRLVPQMHPLVSFDLRDSAAAAPHLWRVADPSVAAAYHQLFFLLPQKGAVEQWVILAYLALPGALPLCPGDRKKGFAVLQTALSGRFVVPVEGDVVYQPHKDEPLKTESRRGEGGFKKLLEGLRFTKEGEGKGVTSASSLAAVQDTPRRRKLCRAQALRLLEQAVAEAEADPPLCAAKAPLIAALAAVARDEALWVLQHWAHRPQSKADAYSQADWQDQSVGELLGAAVRACSLLRANGADVERYWRSFLSGALHTALEAAAERMTQGLAERSCLDALPTLRSFIACVREGTDACALRADWKRLCTRFASPVHPFHGAPGAQEVCRLGCLAHRIAPLAASCDDWLREACSMAPVSYYPEVYHGLFVSALRSASGCRAVGYLFTAVADWTDACHPWRTDEESAEHGEWCSRVADALLELSLKAVSQLMHELRDGPMGYAELSAQVSGEAAAERFHQAHVAALARQDTTRRAKGQQEVVEKPPPGSESQSENLAYVRPRRLAHAQLHGLVAALTSLDGVLVHDKRVFAGESLRLLLADTVRTWVAELGGQVGLKPQAAQMREQLRRCHAVAFACTQMGSFSAQELLLHALLQQCAAPQCWDPRARSIPRQPAASHETFIGHLAHWIAAFAQRIVPEKLLYSPRRRQFVTITAGPGAQGNDSQHRGLPYEEVIGPRDWQVLASLLGPYGVAVVDGLLLNLVRDLLGAIRTAVDVLQLACDELRKLIARRGASPELCLGFESRSAVERSQLLPLSLQLGAALAVRDSLYEGLSRPIERHCAAVHRHLARPGGRPEGVAERKLLVMAAAPLLRLDPFMVEAFRPFDDWAAVNSVCTAYALHFTHSCWERAGEFRCFDDGWRSNLQLLEPALRWVFRFVTYSPPRPPAESLSMACADFCRQAAVVALGTRAAAAERAQPGLRVAFANQLIFLKRLIRGCEVPHDVLLRCVPHSLLREADMLAHRPAGGAEAPQR
eukprot:TRINITY_DN7750_c0_g2_i1.p1 TRINITY_DN7750_c0_g2~~TRINITY_DN7750_c0_g2_i1.p1  ORF type:complete len:1197 (+),score=369.47 TRINITY_DN7750_c0_g2_i1:75-3665(+)